MNVRSSADEVVDKPMLNSSHSNHSYAAAALWCFCERGKTVSTSQSLWVHILVHTGFYENFILFEFLAIAFGEKTFHLSKIFWDFAFNCWSKGRKLNSKSKKTRNQLNRIDQYAPVKYQNSENSIRNEKLISHAMQGKLHTHPHTHTNTPDIGLQVWPFFRLLSLLPVLLLHICFHPSVKDFTVSKISFGLFVNLVTSQILKM